MVAAVTGVLMERGGNLEDSAMTILGGHFAMMLIVEVGDELTATDLERALAAPAAQLGLTVAVRPTADAGRDEPVEGSGWSVSVHGADHPGIVHRVAKLLADRGANIVDLSTRMVVAGDGSPPAYVLRLSVVVPRTTDAESLGAELVALADELQVEVRLRPDDADIL
ncbi:MAG: ACT domain-containing protein [Actinobacteria bacterium]|nr:ACT domain-containing protein [Actinomycetota bacterium]MBW3641917.1 ACT domain-containing protein [Actinomycetota bacterium]